MQRAAIASWIVALAGIATLGPCAHGQFAIGDGTALDRNLQVGAPRANPAGRDLVAEIRFRNAIVTGNAPGGLSFRGDLGYSSAEDFRSPVGSNDIYTFRRDSLYSGLAGMGIRGTEALQRQFGLLTGNTLPGQLAGSMTVPRAGLPSGPAPIGRLDPLDPNADARGKDLWTLRSASATVATMPIEPFMLESRVSETGELVGFVGSGLRGVRVLPLGQAGTLEPQDRSIRSLYRPVESIAVRLDHHEAQTSPTPVAEPLWRRDMQELHNLLQEWDEMDEAKRSPFAPPPGTRPVQPGVEPQEQPIGGARLSPQAIRTLRDGAGQIESLVVEGDEAVSAAEARLREGRYFDAEELFTRAMASGAVGPIPAVGRIHAQIGAGVYTSAAINLRDLFRANPELVGVRYGSAALPTADRLTSVRADLTSRIDAGSRMKADLGLLLAYIGYQTADADAIRVGVTAMRTQEGDPLIDLLDGVWMPD